jgi:NSS family neurotransmitter:Na+ symporter
MRYSELDRFIHSRVIPAGPERLRGARKMSESRQDRWSGRWGLIFAAMGIAIGTGNIWRFPRVAAVYGGGAFFLAYILALFLWAIPLLCAEAVWGKVSRMGVIGAFREICGDGWAPAGTFVAWVSLAISCYYAVILGWCLRYLAYALGGTITRGTDTELLWRGFVSSPVQSMTFFLLALGICAAILLLGVQRGLERAGRIMIPSIFLLLLFLALRASTLPGAGRGLHYLFDFRLADFLRPETYLEAFSQVAWSTGAGWGLFLTYFVYSRKREDILRNSLTVAFADTAAALLAALAVIPTIFALAPDPLGAVRSGDAGLAFVHLTRLFLAIPGGTIMAAAFFLALVFAAVSSEISMLEMGVRILGDTGWPRKKAVCAVTLFCAVLGTPSAWDVRFLNNQDFVWGVGLLISGVCFSFGAMKAGTRRIWVEYIEPCSEIRQEWMWNLIRWIPLCFVVMFVSWIRKAIMLHPHDWIQWLPVTRYADTPMTMLVQWGIAAAAALFLGKILAGRMNHPAGREPD